MALTYGFYNSVNHDRRYDAIQMGQIFDGIIKDGVYETYKQAMIPKASSNANQVIVQPGRAWFDHTWTYIDADYYVSLPAPHASLRRYDAVVLDVNRERASRMNSIKVISGQAATNPSKPSPLRSAEHNQYVLCYVLRRANVSVVSASDIENRVGTSDCPFVVGVIEGLSIDSLIAQWRGEFNDWLAGMKVIFDAWTVAKQKEFDDWTAAEKEEFRAWIAVEKNKLDAWLTSANKKLDDWLKTRETELAQWLANRQAEINFWMTSRQAEFNNWMNGVKAEFNNWMNGVKADFNNWMVGEQNAFLTWLADKDAKYEAMLDHNGTAWHNWFDHIQIELDGDVAGHLQAQIDEIKKFAWIYVVDNVLYVPMSAASVVNKKLIFATTSP